MWPVCRAAHGEPVSGTAAARRIGARRRTACAGGCHRSAHAAGGSSCYLRLSSAHDRSPAAPQFDGGRMTDTVEIAVTINGRVHRLAVSPRRVLADVLREDSQLLGCADKRLAASFTRRRFGSKGCQRSVRPFACSVVIPSCRSLGDLDRHDPPPSPRARSRSGSAHGRGAGGCAPRPR
jgi:hypothetical protein